MRVRFIDDSTNFPDDLFGAILYRVFLEVKWTELHQIVGEHRPMMGLGAPNEFRHVAQFRKRESQARMWWKIEAKF